MDNVSSIDFNNIRLQLTCVIGVVWNVYMAIGVR